MYGSRRGADRQTQQFQGEGMRRTKTTGRRDRFCLPLKQSASLQVGTEAASRALSTHQSPQRPGLPLESSTCWSAIHLRSTLISHRTHTGTRCRDPRVNSHDDTPPVSSRTLLAQLASVKASSFSATWPSRQVYAAGGFSREKRTETKGWSE